MTAVYEGQLSEQVIEGTWKQGLQSLPLTLSREVEAPAVRRPQEPARPYPYAEEDVSVENHEAAITLAGTLTLPAGTGPHPAVILITGSGPQNRDEEVFGHKPFLVLADHLTRRGIAVLRCDDRGTGESTGDFSTTLVAADSSDIAHLVLLAGIGIPGSEFSIIQSKALRPYSVPDEEAYDRFSRTLVDIASSSRTLPDKRAEGIDVPVLSLNGSEDVQVPARMNQDAIRRALESGGNGDVRISELPGLNHMFQECDTCTMDEYARIEQTWSPVALNEITVWLAERISRSRISK